MATTQRARRRGPGGTDTLDVSLAVADQADINWEAAHAAAEGDDAHALLGHLQSIARLAGRAAAPSGQYAEAGEAIPIWALAIFTLAAAKVVAGLAAFALHALGSLAHLSTSQSPLIYLAQVLAYGLGGGVLIGGSREDRRAALLGGFFLLIASSFSSRVVEDLAGAMAAGRWRLGAHMLGAAQPDAFLPLFLWLFARSFPRSRMFGRASGFVDLAVGLSAGTGLLLFAANAALGAAPGAFGPLRSLGARQAPYYYWIPTFGLSLAALPYMFVRLRRADAVEQKRVRMFLLVFVGGLTPMLADIFVESLVPSYADFVGRHQGLVYGVAYALLISIPFTTGYAVMVDRVLDVRLLARRALQYLLVRWTSRLVALVPLAAFAVFLFANRQASVATVLSGYRGLGLLALATLGGITASRGLDWFNAIDRRFFREQYDAGRILSKLVDRSRSARTVTEWFADVAADLDRAMHVDRIHLLVRSRRQGTFVALDGSLAPLQADSALVHLIEADGSPLAIELERPRSPFRLLPLESRIWIADSGARLLVPMVTAEHGLVGVLALGDKRSELAYSGGDRLVLEALAAAGALVVENQTLRASGAGMEVDAASIEDASAVECAACGRIGPPGQTECGCGGRSEASPFPPTLLGKFRLRRRVGAGAMGVVYHATDLALDRQVAIKTLPRVSPEHAERLRREARAMAAVLHHHLAFIYGVESWRGTPLLIVEYLAQGTLTERLRGGPLPIPDVVALGRSVASGLEALHAVGFLHRDIKPSNIGFAADGTPKLLDFGLAHFGFDVSAEPAGTPLYMSAEALEGDPADARFDLWSLAVVLYEATAGVHPLRDQAGWTREAQPGIVADVRTHRPDCPAALARFFDQALSPDRRQRPATAAEFRARLSRGAASRGTHQQEATVT